MPVNRREVLGSLVSGLMVPSALMAEGDWGGGWSGQTNTGGAAVPGGVFLPAAPVYAVQRPHHIEVSFAHKELSYYRAGQPVQGYKVITPSTTATRRGRVTQIIHRPTWTPGTSGRRMFIANGGSAAMRVVPYGHPLNPMGNYKFAINGFGAVRIHGTASYRYSYDQVETLGCVRLMNGSPGINQLVSLLGPTAIAEGIDVVFF